MSTSNVPVFNKYLGNGVATQFSISFPYLKREYIKVYLYRAETDKEELLESHRFRFVNDATIEFPVTTMDSILGEGDVLTVQRETTLGSEFEFDNQRRLFPVEAMNADDLSFQQIQELARDVARSVKVKPTANQTPEALLDTVYGKLDSATEVAQDAIAAANEATIAAEKATTASENAQKQVISTQEYVDNAKADIESTASNAISTVTDYVEETLDGLREDAIKVATDAAKDARTWATGEDDEVQLLEPNEHSSRGYADIAMAIANTPEDVPISDSNLMALNILKIIGEFSGDNLIEGTLNVKDDSNHPLKVTGLAGASASGFQVVDSNGAGESDFEHYATGDRYGTRIANKSTATGKTVNIDLYQTAAGKSVLDLSKPDTILAPQLLDVLFPIGSYYLSEESECPLEDWMEQCQWEIVATQVDNMTVNVFRRTM